MDCGLWPCFKPSYLSSGLIVKAKHTVMNSTLQHAATLRDTLMVPWRKAERATEENEEVSYLTVCGSMQTFVSSPGPPTDLHPLQLQEYA